MLASGTSRAADCAAMCKVPKDGDHVVIDANTGEVTDGGTRFPSSSARVRVTLAGKNPFKYRYRTEIASQSLATGTIPRFLAAAGIGRRDISGEVTR